MGTMIRIREIVDPELKARIVAALAERRLADLERLIREHFGNRSDPEPVRMKELLDREHLTVVADTGYSNGNAAAACEADNVEYLQHGSPLF